MANSSCSYSAHFPASSHTSPYSASQNDLSAISEERRREIHGDPLDSWEAKQYLSTAALLNFVTADRPELLFAVKDVLRASSAPGTEELRRQRILRDLRHVPRVELVMPWETDRRKVIAAVDADFAGCRETRRSTCGGYLRWGRCLIKSWSRTVRIIALSTGGSELGAVVKGATELEGAVSLLRDLGIEAEGVLQSDASAAIGISQRQGLGKIRHLSVADL